MSDLTSFANRNPTYRHLSSLEVSQVGAKQTKIISIGPDDNVYTALKILSENKILSAPVLDGKGGFVGFLDVLDVLTWISQHANKANVTEAELLSLQLGTENVAKLVGQSDRNPFEPLTFNMPAAALAELFAVGIHRIPLCETEEAPITQLVSQTDLCRYLMAHKHLPEIKSLLSKAPTTQATRLGSKLITTQKDQTTLQTLKLLQENLISAVPIVDGEGKLIASFSSARLRGLSQSNFADLLLPLGQFVEKFGGSTAPVTATVTDTIEQILEKMLGNGSHRHRLWVVENGKPIGVVSMTEIMKEIRDTGLENFAKKFSIGWPNSKSQRLVTSLGFQRQATLASMDALGNSGSILAMGAVYAVNAGSDFALEDDEPELYNEAEESRKETLSFIKDWRNGTHINDIAEKHDCTVKQVESRYKAIRRAQDEMSDLLQEASEERRQSQPNLWTVEQELELVKLKKVSGMKTKQISELLGRSVKAIENKWVRIQTKKKGLLREFRDQQSAQKALQQHAEQSTTPPETPTNHKKRKRDSRSGTPSAKRQKKEEASAKDHSATGDIDTASAAASLVASVEDHLIEPPTPGLFTTDKIMTKTLAEFMRTSPLAHSPKIKATLFGGGIASSPSRPSGPSKAASTSQWKSPTSPRGLSAEAKQLPFNLFNPNEKAERRLSAANTINVLATFGFRKRSLKLSRDLSLEQVRDRLASSFVDVLSKPHISVVVWMDVTKENVDLAACGWASLPPQVKLEVAESN